MYEEQNNTVVNNMTPLVIHQCPKGAPSVIQRVTAPTHPAVQIGFPFHVTHSPNLLLIPVNERMNIRLFPTVMLNVAGYCDRCIKYYDQVALETLGEYLSATAYEGETVRDRGCDRGQSKMASKLLFSDLKMRTVGAPALRWSRSATLNKQKSSRIQQNLET